jgi:hypothetical protein
MAPDTSARLEASLDSQGAAGGAQGRLLAVLARRVSGSGESASSASLGSVEGLSMPPAQAFGFPFHVANSRSEATAGLDPTGPGRGPPSAPRFIWPTPGK